MPRLFTTPFASGGDKVVVPDAPQPDGSVSYSEGYTLDYELVNTDPDYKPVPRDGMNGLFYDLTDAVGAIQAKGLTAWSNLINYTVPAVVFGSDGKVYSALQASGPGTAVKDPVTEPAYWVPAIGSGALIGVRVFRSVGSATYTPTPGTSSVVVEVVGGGGAGGGAAATAVGTWAVGGGGGAGAFALSRFTAAFSGVTVTIGAGGTPVVGAWGGNGGTTSFGALLSCPGGLGGALGPSVSTPAIQAAGGFGGAAPSGGNIIAARGDHGRQGFGVAPGNWITGAGGSNYGGGGFPLPAPASGNGNAGLAPGSGGSGAASFGGGGAQSGGAGAPGVVIIWEYA